MANITVKDPGRVKSCGDQIINKSSEYKKQINSIYETVNTLKSNWTGAASQRFVEDIGKFEEDYKKFGDLINEFGQLLVEVGKAYEDLEKNL